MAKMHKVYGKEYKSLKTLANEFKVPYSTLYGTLKRRNNGAEDALNFIKAKNERDLSEKINDISVDRVDLILTQSNIINQDNNFIKKLDSLFEIIDILKKDRGESIKINLIDYENLSQSSKLKKYLIQDTNVLNIFFYNACIYSNEYYKFIKDIPNINNYQILTYTIADQLVDHLIVYYLGFLSLKYPHDKLTIVSNDTGYYKFVASLNNPNISVHSTEYAYIESAEKRYKYSICKYILNNKNIVHGSSFSENELKIVFGNFHKNKQNNIKDLIEKLSECDIVTEVTIANKVYYKFNEYKAREIFEDINKD